MSTYVVNHAGGSNGEFVDMIPLNTGDKITIKSGDYVDSITVSGQDKGKIGGTGGANTSTLTLREGEKIVNVYVEYGDYIDHIKFTTNQGRDLQGGKSKRVTKKATFEGEQLIALTGRGGQYVDYLSLLFEKR